MRAIGFTLFDTGIGQCGVAWTDEAIAGVDLPEAAAMATAQRLRRLFPQACFAEPLPHAQRAIELMVQLLAGSAADLTVIGLDLAGVAPFDASVYEVTRQIPSGSTLTYGEVAARIGKSGAAQAVGRALGRNPVPIIVPCHRVLGADGKPVGFSAHGGIDTKSRMLAIEKVPGFGEPALFDIE